MHLSKSIGESNSDLLIDRYSTIEILANITNNPACRTRHIFLLVITVISSAYLPASIQYAHWHDSPGLTQKFTIITILAFAACGRGWENTEIVAFSVTKIKKNLYPEWWRTSPYLFIYYLFKPIIWREGI